MNVNSQTQNSLYYYVDIVHYLGTVISNEHKLSVSASVNRWCFNVLYDKTCSTAYCQISWCSH